MSRGFFFLARLVRREIVEPSSSTGKMAMVRITTVHSNKHVCLYLEGRLAGEAVDTLRRELVRWQRQCKPLWLDFKGVGFIDEDGMELLQSWRGPGLRLRAASDFIEALLAQYGLHVDRERR